MERELLLLGLLRQQNMHGYELHDFIDRYMQTCVDLKKPTAYYLLGKLAEAGYVEETSDYNGNRPPRKVYHITEHGEQYFQQLLRENLASHAPARFADIVGMAFLDEIPVDEATQLLQSRRDYLQTELENVQSVPNHPGSMHFVIEHQIHHLRSEISWLENVMNELEQ